MLAKPVLARQHGLTRHSDNTELELMMANTEHSEVESHTISDAPSAAKPLRRRRRTSTETRTGKHRQPERRDRKTQEKKAATALESLEQAMRLQQFLTEDPPWSQLRPTYEQNFVSSLGHVINRLQVADRETEKDGLELELEEML